MAAVRRRFSDDNLAVDLFFQRGDVGDDADQTVSFRQTRQHFHRQTQRFLVERTESLVDEHRIELNPAGIGLDFIRQTERQRERRQK